MLNFYVATKKGSTRFEHGDGPIEFGREPREGMFRYVLRDPYVSADQLRVVECPGYRVRLENLSRRVVVSFANGELLQPGGSGEFALPLRLKVGESLIEIAHALRMRARRSRPGDDRAADHGRALAVLAGPAGTGGLAEPRAVDPLVRSRDHRAAGGDGVGGVLSRDGAARWSIWSGSTWR